MSSESAAPGPRSTVELPPEGPHGLLGRDKDLARLDEAWSETSTVLLTGAAGVGKTELACGFARSQAGRRNGQLDVLFIAFQYGAGLPRVLHELGTTLRGISFARLPLDQQRRWVVDYVRGNPCLLVWDAFDHAFQYLDGSETRELVDLLHDLSGGTGRHLITVRNPDWAGSAGDGTGPSLAYRRVDLAGLPEEDGRRLAGLILEQAQVDAEGLGPGYPPLLRALGGNPMAMRIVLPHLREQGAQKLALDLAEPARLQPEGSRDLDAALDCAFSNLSPKTRNHLPFISVFSQRLLLDVVTHITQGPGYASVTGEELGWGACRTLLREARQCAILESVSPSVYLMSDHVARFLRGKLEQRVAAPQIAALEREFLRVYSDMGDYFMENLATEEAESTVTGVLAEEANLLHALAQARVAGDWDAAQLVLQPLAQVYKMQERVLELRRLREGLLAAIGLDPEVAERNGATSLWMYLQGTELNDSIGRNELDAAEAICRRVLAYLQSKGDSSYQAQMASLHHHLGLVAQGKGRPDEAEDWYRRALETNEAQGNEAECADSYHQLGLIAQSRRRYEEAEEWHRRALEVRERLEDQGESAVESYQLGLVAEATLQFQEAAEWHHKARIAYEHVGDRRGEAHACHRLGMLAQAHYDYEEASTWYQRALLIHEELGDEAEAADDCLQMGVIVLSRYGYEEAEEWLHQALGIFQQQGRESSAATAYHHLGVAAHGRRKVQEAEERYQKALEIMVRLEDEVGAAGTWGQLGLLAEQRGNHPHAVWYVAHTYEIAKVHHLPILANAVKHLSRLRSMMGTGAFLASWQEVSDSDILAELEKSDGGAGPG